MAYRALTVATVCLLVLGGCADDGGLAPPPFMGSGGNGNTPGTGGTGNTVATGGTGGDAGMGGGTAGTGGQTGTGGSTGGTGGTGNTGGVPECIVNSLCPSCDINFFCRAGVDCRSGCTRTLDCPPGWVCAPSGCTTPTGGPINRCQENFGGECVDDDECPSPSAPDPDYTCEDVPLNGKACVKQTPGCNDNFDCITGFSCEEGVCVDRRVPCRGDDDCPVNYSCETLVGTTRACDRIFESCETDHDCSGGSNWCDDVDGDGREECTGNLKEDPPGQQLRPCVNSLCSGSTPVCEASLSGGQMVCGQFGLCQSDADCADDSFECLGLWPDGRKECVKKGGTCDLIERPCDVNQVCAAPRAGGPPACQSGNPI